MPQCSICGELATAEATFCSRCGARLVATDQPIDSAAMRDIAQELQQTLRDHPDDADAHYQLALAFMYDGRWGPAAEHLIEVTRLAANFADAYANLALCLAHLGKIEHATQAIEAALRLDPDRPRFVQLHAQIVRKAPDAQ